MAIFLDILTLKKLFPVIDATGKPASGYYAGNVYHIGNYDECISIEHNTNGTTITGKYCLALITPAKKSFKNLMLAVSIIVNINLKLMNGYIRRSIEQL